MKKLISGILSELFASDDDINAFNEKSDPGWDNSEERKQKIRRFFELVYPNGYRDSKICIDNLQIRENSYYSYSEGDTIYERTYLGRVSIIGGPVVYDPLNDIYHPGMWENYVIDIVNAMEDNIRMEQARKKEIEERKREERRKELERQYKEKHAPIDDKKFFQ